ncbi:MAG TPA: aconitate hydratase AcnA [Kofleriaceae bacterium]|nr:aconitate hydratase AcnA [Kofleriaceae bacterium]
MSRDSYSSRASISLPGGGKATIFRLDALRKARVGDIDTLPFSLRVLLENLLRHEDDMSVTREDIAAVAAWDPAATPEVEIAFRPARVILQDFTGVPAVVDLAAMREAFAALGGRPEDMNPLRPSDLVIDHSVQVDSYGKLTSFRRNVELEYQRNQERYQFLRWGQQAMRGLRVVPPGTGIVHQVNLEYLARVVFFEDEGGETFAFPDTLVGTDSHTTMINGLGVVGWGVGGIEAEAAVLGEGMPMLLPQVVGFRLTGKLPAGSTATDLVLTVTQMLRTRGVVGKFVEFFGDGLDALSLPDRATIANMAPEYGATMGFFPVDDETLSYMRFSGRDPAHIERTRAYLVEQGLFRQPGSPVPRFTDTLVLDLADVVPSIAGPKRPQDRIALSGAQGAWRRTLIGLVGDKIGERRAAAESWAAAGERVPAGVSALDLRVQGTGETGPYEIGHGDVIIAAITSCTNTSNPSVMLAAGILAKKAAARGLTTKPWVKTSLAPGSQVVSDYLKQAGLLEPLEKLGFFLVGYGCTTCIGNSGPVDEPIAATIKDHNLVVASVLSGNRNFEGRINPSVVVNYLASPPLVVAYALAGTMDVDFERHPIGTDPQGKDVFLRDVWPSPEEVGAAHKAGVKAEMFRSRYAAVFEGTEEWRKLQIPSGMLFQWDDASTYIRRPPYFDGMSAEPPGMGDITGARALAVLGDSVTTDHISPAGSIAKTSPAAKYLGEHGVAPADFNQYGARRGNHEVMVRGTFANIRLRNLLVPGVEGGVTVHLPDGEQMSIYDAAMRYVEEKVPLMVIAGEEYGTGSSRDWAAKGTALLGVRAVLAESYERIHRSNLVGMGVLPLQFLPGQSRETVGLTGREVYDVVGISEGLAPGKQLTVRADDKAFPVVCRVDSPQEVEYLLHGGILPYVLRQRVATAGRK